MRFRAFLFATITFIVCCNVVSPSDDVDASISKTTSSQLVRSADTASVSGRRLRTSKAENGGSDDEERANAVYENLAAFFAKLSGKKAPVGLTRTYPSPPNADKLTRSKTFPAEKAASPKLTKSQTFSTAKLDWDDAISAAKNIKASIKAETRKRFEILDLRKNDPDWVFDQLSLDPKLASTTKADKHKLWEAAKGNHERHGEYVMWYRYKKFYKQRHPDWISKIGKEKLD